MIVFSLLGLLIVGGGVMWYAQGELMPSNGNEVETAKNSHGAQGAVSGAVTEEDLETFEEEGKNPFGETIPADKLSEDNVKDYIHGMSHQKVKAKKKWYFYEMHPERITWLLESLDQVELKHEDVYKRILKKWQAGNFDTVDDDHNAIWNLNNGTVGKATGILSPEEEKKFVEKNK
ncbi:DUF6241 domain-containing protein [Halobacillus yeomjeoni]|uniref:DUF6241 domain-containing protein n=1 Tax=Halobacillus yeomjeoni TaxID=311194 RepID=UPI001CD2318E|nr:DUF6241 domain-containing protein [Halobacillus yeomjeoni]MCA0984081.1 DUF6241 domain-containing protein [Halobacillus yeomjeoni]